MLKLSIKSKALLSVLPTILLLLAFTSCTGEKGIDFSSSEIAAIESSTTNSTSYVNLYDQSGHRVNGFTVNCPDINSGFLTPVRDGSDVFANSIGGYDNRSRKLIDFDLRHGSISMMDIATGILSIAADKNYLYASYSPLGGAVIVRRKRHSDDKGISLKISGVLENMILSNGRLYAFSVPDDRQGTLVSVIDTAGFKLKRAFKYNSGAEVFDSTAYNGYIYFTHIMAGDDQTPSTTLSRLDQSGDITDIPLNIKYPYEIRRAGSKLYISGFNPMTGDGSSVTVYDTGTRSQKVLDTGHRITQIEVSGGQLYTCDGDSIHTYDLHSLNLSKSFRVYDGRPGYRINGFFITK